MTILHHPEPDATATQPGTPAKHAPWCAMPDPHTPDECASSIVLYDPAGPGIWVTRTEHGSRLVIDAPGMPVLTADTVESLIGVLTDARPMLDGQS